MARRFEVFLLLLFVGLFFATEASAQRVLVARPPADDRLLFEAFGRLRAELALQSFEVLALDEESSVLGPAELEAKAQERSAFAVVALRRDGSGTAAEICIVDRVTGKTTIRKVRIDPSQEGPLLLAVRAVELLRLSLLEFDARRPPDRDVLGKQEEPPAPEVVRFSRELSHFQVRVGGLLLFSPAVGAGLGAELGAHYRFDERFRLGLVLGGPLFGAEFRASAGRASVRQELALLRAAWNLGAPLSELEWGPVVGLGVHHLEASGNVELPLVGRTEDLVSAAADVGLGLEYFLHSSLSLTLEASCLTLWPRPVVAVEDETSGPLAVQLRAVAGIGVSF